MWHGHSAQSDRLFSCSSALTAKPADERWTRGRATFRAREETDMEEAIIKILDIMTYASLVGIVLSIAKKVIDAISSKFKK